MGNRRGHSDRADNRGDRLCHVYSLGVLQILECVGVVMKVKRPNAWNIPMILHDYNAGATSAHLCKIYGFSSARACQDRIAKWRKAGWNFQYKTEEKQLTQQSEEITEGCIRQGGEEK